MLTQIKEGNQSRVEWSREGELARYYSGIKISNVVIEFGANNVGGKGGHKLDFAGYHNVVAS